MNLKCLGKNSCVCSRFPLIFSQSQKEGGLDIAQAPLIKQTKNYEMIVTVDNHFTAFGQGNILISKLAREGLRHTKIMSLGLEDIPACGQNAEVLQHHKLDANSIAKKIKNGFLSKSKN